jgi:hypothetical protein
VIGAIAPGAHAALGCWMIARIPSARAFGIAALVLGAGAVALLLLRHAQSPGEAAERFAACRDNPTCVGGGFLP